MYPVKNPAPDARPGNFSSTPWTFIKLLVVCLVTVSVPYALYVRVDSKNVKATVTTQASGRSGSYLNVQEGRALRAEYLGEQSVVQAMQSGQAKARALASADLDGDATPDLLAGYNYGSTGIVTIQRGNPEAFAPKDESVYQRMHDGYNPNSLLPTAETYQIPVSADFLQAGDFNNDGRKDVLVAAQGGDLYLLAGDAEGNLIAAQQVLLPGVVTAVAAGEFRAPDGRADLAVGIDGPSGPQVLIYDGANGVSGEPMRLALANRATSLEFGEVDDSPFRGLAVATGSEIDVIHGWGRKVPAQLESRVEKIDTGTNVRGLASGFFMWSREGSKQLAALGDDGTIRIFGRGQLNTQPFSEQEIDARARLRLQPKRTTPVDVEMLSGWRSTQAEQWIKSRELVTGKFVGADASTRNLLRGADISFSDTDDLMVLGGGSKLDIIRQVDTTKSAPASANLIGGDFTTTSLESADAPATLALPQKLNGWRDLVVMEAGSVSPTLLPLAPTATITVDRTDDPSGAGLTTASACTGALNDCSLRGAVQFANANSGTVISLSTATYVLAINGALGCLHELPTSTGNTLGDLEINATTTVTGTGAGLSIVRQGSGANDRVMCLDTGLVAGRTYSFSGLTITGGRDVGSGVGGGAIIGGAKSTTLSLTNVTFANNQTT
ncbi:MAG TPA: VCBS repeat-containing protein, partial [Pyrinomonadaceae bacterium]|nr:VCBS repeat-containing protein [Pyrinomonadaceae bacterium]